MRKNESEKSYSDMIMQQAQHFVRTSTLAYGSVRHSNKAP